MSRQEFDNTNRGVLFKNDRKETELDRDYSGSINIDGRDYWLSAWVKVSSKDGRKFFSLSAKPKDEQRPTAGRAVPIDDEIPF